MRPELPAAQARRPARHPARSTPRHGSRSWRTLCVCSARNSRSRVAQIRPRVREDRHREHARVGRARLADGERADRHAAGHLDDREQRIEPLQRGALHRNAKHGQHACAPRPCPGRCAAPPAPAMITSTPRASAPVANSAIHTGVRCAETMCRSCSTPNCSSTSTACFIVSQSDEEPMMTATSG